MQDNKNLTLLLEGARRAGRIALRYFRHSPQIWYKENDAGPVTQADLEIDEMLKTFFLEACASYGWLSEESDDTNNRLSCDNVFIIDPIDGTRSFIEGSENFAISLAIAHKGIITDAVVYLPAKNITYFAIKNQGAFKNDTPIQARNTHQIENADVLTTRATLNDTRWRTPLPIERHFRSSLAYRFCLIAEGRFDAMLTLRPTWEWDSAAGSLIANEANARAVDLSGNAPLYNSKEKRHSGFIVASPPLVQKFLEELHAPPY